MLVLEVDEGQAVQLGEVAVIKYLKNISRPHSRRIKLAFATKIAPITLIATGLIPERFTVGITGIPRPSREAAREPPAQAVA